MEGGGGGGGGVLINLFEENLACGKAKQICELNQ